jgi:hypothetical protein
MSDTKIDSFPFGAGKYLPVDHTGPASYAVTGDVIGAINNMTGITVLGLSTIDNVEGSGSFSVSGAFQVFTQPTGRGSRKTWLLLWNSTGGVVSVTQNAAGTGMTPGTYPLVFAGGGGGTGAAGTVTVLTATTIATPVITSAGRGYTTTPTASFTAVTGTPATLTVTNIVPAGPVPALTNLSAEVVRLAYIGR